MATARDVQALDGLGQYRYGFADPDTSVYRSAKGRAREVVEHISGMKEEPAWMLEYRLKGLEHYLARPLPKWGGDLEQINFDNITYYVRPAEAEGKTWEDVPDAIKATFDKLGIPEAERKFLAGVGEGRLDGIGDIFPG